MVSEGFGGGSSYWGEVASSVITADMTDLNHAWFRLGSQLKPQQVLQPSPRYLGRELGQADIGGLIVTVGGDASDPFWASIACTVTTREANVS